MDGWFFAIIMPLRGSILQVAKLRIKDGAEWSNTHFDFKTFSKFDWFPCSIEGGGGRIKDGWDFFLQSLKGELS